MKKILERKHFILQYLKTGFIFALIYALIEYFVRIGTDDPVTFIPLLIRAASAGVIVTISAALFEIFLYHSLMNLNFVSQLTLRTIFYTFIITFWLGIINGIWGMIERGMSFLDGMYDYFSDASYLFNLLIISLFLALVLIANQIRSLHKRGELSNYLLGRYNTPKEVERIFCFADLNGSTAIAEKLGHIKFASLLKDYYFDVGTAIESTRTEIYQFIGDEVVLSWDYPDGIKSQNCLQCFFKMKDAIDYRKDYYLQKYGLIPTFRAGVHCGKVTVTWVGAYRKEIVYLGDVLNTAKRLEETCKKFERDFLVSEQVLNLFDGKSTFKSEFLENATLRGKEEKVAIYGLSLSHT